MKLEQQMREKFGDFNVDVDLMRDVYMTPSQREAYNRILSRALEQREAATVEPIAVSDLPAFPTMLRKMWSGGDVQRWINDNIKPLIQERHHDQMCATPPRDVPDGFVLVPRVPTYEMLCAGDFAAGRGNGRLSLPIYAAMLAAAPRPDKENGQ